ncbi:hypothetical protein [Pandoraea anhela]|uniref:Uncharacterized protein n=1 Tax=Pandoraea anhela TaxID=2508295 RepID=A0A5E4V0P3_9BURK|nr:hypothetical protein [Pandoraea anhela]VVE05786.1 hypothetical protein PAN31108_02364 [Pandoraea anhela]
MPMPAAWAATGDIADACGIRVGDMTQALARKIECLLRERVDAWTSEHLEHLGVDRLAASHLVAHLRATPFIPFTSSEVLTMLTAGATAVEKVLDMLVNGLAARDSSAHASLAGDGMAVVVLIGRAIGGATLADMRLPESMGGHGFVQALLDSFVGRTAPDVTGVANVATALSIVLGCGAGIAAVAFGGVPPLIYALSRGVPDLVLNVLLRYDADPNEPLMRDDLSGPACGLDYVAGGTALHHAALAGRGAAMSTFFLDYGGRLDAMTYDGYDPIALAGATAHRVSWPRYGLIESTLLALYAWIATDTVESRRRINGEHLCEVLATRLLELGRSVDAGALHHWLGAMAQLKGYGCDVASVLYGPASHGGASYAARIRDMMQAWFGDNSREAQALTDGDTLDAAGDIEAWFRELERPARWPVDDRASPRRVMRATQGPLFGDWRARSAES